MVEVEFGRVDVGRSEGRSHVFISTGNRLDLTDQESGLQLRKHGCIACFCLFLRLVHMPALQYSTSGRVS